MAGGRCGGSFHHSMRVGSSLPPLSSITYTGIFNQHSYFVGKPEQDEAVAACYAWAKDVDWSGEGSESSDAVVACFLKSHLDGQPRDETPIDLVVVLDISCSMSCAVTQNGESRLDLAKQALKALFPRLRGARWHYYGCRHGCRSADTPLCRCIWPQSGMSAPSIAFPHGHGRRQPRTVETDDCPASQARTLCFLRWYR
eukprot:TRINITY_DN952_c0_g2_i1.p1 TRINITY_DN952_c0_g2~~TRINITY_DN952_c0_g2_i1.p1  ORF type:complete len:212 (-),score=27.35 TRINITY_DN952_c0_g2_i1:1253-1849(-)